MINTTEDAQPSENAKKKRKIKDNKPGEVLSIG